MLYILLLILPFAIYAALAMALLFHLKRYNIDQNSTKKISAIFIGVLVALGILTSVAFYNVPWNNLNLNKMFGDFFQSSSPINLNQ